MNNPKRYPVDFTLGQVVDLLAQLKSNYASSNYSIERLLNDTPEETADHSWIVSDAERNLETRATLAGLITQITGEPFGDPDEAATAAKAVKAYNDYKAAQDALDDAVEVDA